MRVERARMRAPEVVRDRRAEAVELHAAGALVRVHREARIRDLVGLDHLQAGLVRHAQDRCASA
jgi:hypothetical protein